LPPKFIFRILEKMSQINSTATTSESSYLVLCVLYTLYRGYYFYDTRNAFEFYFSGCNLRTLLEAIS
jgi:hypothetical protein